jgi:hypothetical protein
MQLLAACLADDWPARNRGQGGYACTPLAQPPPGQEDCEHPSTNIYRDLIIQELRESFHHLLGLLEMAQAQDATRNLDLSKLPEFTYEPLDDGSTDLRLLHVLPGLDNSGRINVEMWNVSSKGKGNNDYPEYQCLSYTWGAPDDGHVICLNGRSFRIRRNLWDFLSQAAQTLSMQAFWFDAICIDQSSVREKNIQVTRMGQIYRRAQTVMVWFGNDISLIPLARFMAHGNSMEYSHEVDQTDRELSYVAFWNHSYWTRACELCCK